MKREYLWALLTLVIAVGLAILLVNIVKDDVASPQTQVCASPEDRDRIRKLELDAFDNAFHDHITKLFSIWVHDPNQQQPKRASIGNDIAIKAYMHARQLVLDWNPPPC